MPVAGLTDEKSVDLRRGLSRLAKVKKGAPKVEGKRPMDLTYFRMDWQDGFQHLAPVFAKYYSDQPQAIQGLCLLGETVDQIFETWKEEYITNGTQIRQCTGSTDQVKGIQKSALNRETGEREHDIPCVSPECNCKLIGRLYFLLPEFMKNTGEFGYFVLETHSINDVTRLYNFLRMVQNEVKIPLSKIPFELGRASRQVMAPDPKNAGKKIKTTKSLLSLKISPDFMLNFAQALADPSAGQKQIPAGVTFEGGSETINPETGEYFSEDQVIEDDGVDYSQTPDQELNERQQEQAEQKHQQAKGEITGLLDTDKKRNGFLQMVYKMGIPSTEQVKILIAAGFGDPKSGVKWKEITAEQALSVLFPDQYGEETPNY